MNSIGMQDSESEAFQNLVGRQFKEVGCTHDSKKTDI